MGHSLSRFDMYRSIPDEFTKKSPTGGLCTLVAFGFVASVILMEVSSILSIEHISYTELDHAQDLGVYFNFNVSLHDLSCDFIQVTVREMFSLEEHSVPSGSVNKINWLGGFAGSGLRSEWLDPSHPEQQARSNLPEYLKVPPREVTPEDITEEELQNQIKEGKNLINILSPEEYDATTGGDFLALVEFFGAWCTLCDPVSDIFARSAYQISQISEKVKFYRFDCTTRDGMNKCRERLVQGFPAIHIYSTNKDLNPYEETAHVYNGERKTESIVTYAKYLLKFLEEGKEAAETMNENLQEGKSRISGKGCRIEGSVPMNKVPTEVHIQAKSHYHHMNTSLFTMGHTIHHVSVGKMLPEFRLVTQHEAQNPDKIIAGNERAKKKLKEVRNRIEDAFHATHGQRSRERVTTGKSLKLKEQDKLDYTSHGQLSFDHYVRIVPISLFPIRGRELNDFDYTLSTNRHQINFGVTPDLTFKAELNPIRIVLEEQRKSYSTIFINLMALVGGIFSSMKIVQGIFTTGVNFISKKYD